MVIKSLKIDGYGRLHGLIVYFSQGLNMIYGSNETGKSTMVRCLVSLLYGQNTLNKDGLNERELMVPWDGSPYTASLEYELKDNEKFRVTRDFGTGNVTVINLETGEDITGTFTRDSDNEPRFALQHLGLEKNCFVSTVLIQQNEMSKLGNRRDISRKILSIVDKSGGDTGYIDGINKLKAAGDEIGSDEVPWTPLGKLSIIVSTREDAIRETEKKKKEVEKLEADKEQLQADLKTVEKEFRKLLYLRSRTDMEKYQSIIDQVKTLEDEIPKLQYKLDRTIRYGMVDMEGRTRLYSLKVDVDSLDKRLKEMDERRGGMMDEYRELKDTLNEKKGILEIDGDILELFDITEVPKEKRSALIESRKKLLAGSNREMEEIKRKYIEEADKFSSFRNAAEYNERVADLEAKIGKKELMVMKEEEIARLEVESQKFKSMIRSRVLISILLMVAGGLLSLSGFADVFSVEILKFTQDRLIFGAGLAMLAFGVIYWLTSFSLRKDRELIQNNINKRNEEIKGIKDDVASAQIGLKELFTKIGVLSVDDLRTKYREFNRLKIDMETTINLVKTLEKELSSLMGDYEESTELKQLMIELGYVRADEKIEPEHMKKFRDDFRKTKKLEERVESMRKEYESLADNRKEVQEKISLLNEEMKGILSEGQVNDLEAYDAALNDIQEMNRNRAALNSMLDKKKLLLQDKKVNDFMKRVERIRIDLKNIESDNPDFLTLDISGVDPDGIADELENLRPRQVDITSRLSSLETMIQNIRERYLNRDDTAEFEQMKREMNRLLRHKQALEIAIGEIRKAGREFHEKYFAPRLSRCMEDLLFRITGKYNDVIIDEILNVSVRSSEDTAPIGIENLSRGAVDQVYFALRAGIIRMLSDCEPDLPLVMDEPFLQFDEDRRKRTLDILINGNIKRQVLLFTDSRKQKQELAELLKTGGRKAGLVHIGDMELIKPA